MIYIMMYSNNISLTILGFFNLQNKIKPYGTPYPHITLIFQQGISTDSEPQQLLGVLNKKKRGGGERHNKILIQDIKKYHN